MKMIHPKSGSFFLIALITVRKLKKVKIKNIDDVIISKIVW